jgi:hypothetical protein
MAGFIIALLFLMGVGCGERKELHRDAEDGVESLAGEPHSDVIAVRDADYTEGVPPARRGVDAGVPVILRVTGPATVTNGGTAILHVEVSRAVSAPIFLVSLEGEEGYHTVPGADPEGDGIYDISVQVSGSANQSSLVLSVSLLDALGNPGPAEQVEIVLIHSGTGDVKVTLSFDRLHDLDLHVVEPSGDEIFYQRPQSITGGSLDLDSGANCAPSAAHSENIFWPSGAAPVGEYRVHVQNFQSCTPGKIAFTVTVAHGGSVQTFNHEFADGTAGEVPGVANVLEITAFRHER